jgi:hypothetical protein
MIKTVFDIKDQHLQNTCIGFVNNNIPEIAILNYIKGNSSMVLKTRTDVCFIAELKYGGEYVIGIDFDNLINYFKNNF